MNNTNRFFCQVIGVFFLLLATGMTMRGYWPSLQGFGVSERLFIVMMWAAYGMGAAAVVAGIFSPQPKT